MKNIEKRKDSRGNVDKRDYSSQDWRRREIMVAERSFFLSLLPPDQND